MKAGGSRKKRWLKVLGGACLVIGLIVVALPVWFPWVLRPVLARFGVRFDSYERVGYSRFALTNVHRDAPNARFRCERVVGFLPPRWLWLRYSHGADADIFLTVARWSVQIGPATGLQPKSPAAPPGSTFALAEAVKVALPAWRTWLPAAQLTDGRVEFGSDWVVVAAANWRRGRVTATVVPSRTRATFVLDGNFSGALPYAISFEADSFGVTGRVRLSRATDRWQAAGEINWKSNRVEMEAEFDRSGWWPSRAGLKSDRFRVPTDLLRLEGYDDPTGAFAFDWVDGRFRLEGSARATPNAVAPVFAPPLELSLLARGDAESVVLEKLRITSPAIQADLSAPIGLNRSAKLTTEAATLRVALDLGQIHGLSFRGKLNGQVRVRPMPTGQPMAEFELSGEELAARGFSVAHAQLGGRLRWPVLELDDAKLDFTDGSALGSAGEIELKSREISNGRWRFQGAWARRFLPDGFSYSSLQATGQINGPISAPIHSGELRAEDFSAPPLKPCRALARWRGENLTLSQLNVTLASGESVLEFDGAVKPGFPPDRSWDVDLKNFTLTRDGDALFRLEKRCRIGVIRRAPAQDGSRPPNWGVIVEGFHWTGPDRGLRLDGDVTWPERGKAEISGHGLLFADVQEFVNVAAWGAALTAIDLKAHWDGGPIEFKLSATGELSAIEDETFAADINLSGGADGLVAEPLVVSAEGTEIVRARGKVPLIITPERGTVRVRVEEKNPFNFQAATEPNRAFWDFASKHLGIRFVGPKAEAALEGTFADVRGTLRVQASQIGRPGSTNDAQVPPLDKLRIEARFDRDRVRLTEFSFEVENQPVRITGDLPIRENFLLEFISNGTLPDWRRARARVEVADARIEPFARYLPGILTPQGRLNLSLDVVPGGEVNGELKISGAATRPFSPLAPIRDIRATVLFCGRSATIGQFTGRIGGREVELRGHFELPESGGPQFNLRLRGDNVPLVYRPGLLLRSDFDFQLAQAGDQPATLSGDVTLRDGLFLQDLKALVPSGRAEPLGRPPYFSVAERPFAGWKLNVKVHGDRFLRVRTPYFRGEVSAKFQIRGDFEEPQALGEARINSGLVRFPFGTLNIDQGHASLTSDEPYEPQLFLAASSRLYGYNIKMEITGTASAPFISFNSTPPLTSEQILLMLAAGDLPRDDLSFSREKKVGNFALYLGKDIIARWLGNEDSADRLTIRSGEDISQEGKTTYYLEYKLADDWSVIGEYDRFNALNAGLKWRIFSR